MYKRFDQPEYPYIDTALDPPPLEVSEQSDMYTSIDCPEEPIYIEAEF